MKHFLPVLYSIFVVMVSFLATSQNAQAQAKVQSTTAVYVPASGSNGFEADVTIKYKFMNVYGDFYVALDGSASHRGSGTYWYEGKAYNSQTVPALANVFDRTKLSYPAITVDVFKGSARVTTFSHRVVFGMGGALGEGRNLTELLGKVSESELGQYSLRNMRVTEISDVSAAIGWMEAQDAIKKHLRKAKYDTKMQEADHLFAAKDYEGAKQAYKEASSMGADDSRASDRIKEINEVLKKQESDKKYAETIKVADALLAQGEYSEAKSAYSSAANYTSDMSYAEQQITKIDGLVAKAKQEEASKAEKSMSAEKTESSLSSKSSSTAATVAESEGKGESVQSYQENQAAARQAAQETQEAKERAENERKEKAQNEYDTWKAQKDTERQQMEAASIAGSVSVLYLLGGIIYDNMGKVNPDFIFKPFDNKLKFYAGIDVGYSASVFPIVFQSHITTMKNGKYVTQKSLQKKDVFTVNLDVQGKIGAEHPKYGFYGYLAPKVGFSPIFDAFNFSPLVFGGRAFGGLKWVKAYADYSSGTREFTTTSNDVEESGKGKSAISFNKFEFGLRFTTNPNADYVRNHISIGLIQETLSPEGLQIYVDPVTNSRIGGKKSPVMTGYAFQWKKDHTFNFYANVYLDYIYSGEVGYDAGGPDNSFNDKQTGPLVEVGFIRSFDFWK